MAGAEGFDWSEATTTSLLFTKMAGDEGFEPPNGGTRTHCLTTWRIPNGLFGLSYFSTKCEKMQSPGRDARGFKVN